MDFVIFSYLIGLIFAIVSAVTGELGAMVAGFIFVMVASIVERWNR